MPRFVVKDAAGERPLDIDASVIVLGRASENQIQVRDQMASRKHCQVERDGETWKLVDLESSNGTQVNGKLVNKHVLADGDEIGIGDARIRFHPKAPAPVPAAAPESSPSPAPVTPAAAQPLASAAPVALAELGQSPASPVPSGDSPAIQAVAANVVANIVSSAEDKPAATRGARARRATTRKARKPGAKSESGDLAGEEKMKTTRKRRSLPGRGGIPGPVLGGGIALGVVVLVVVALNISPSQTVDPNQVYLEEARELFEKGDLGGAEAKLGEIAGASDEVRKGRDELLAKIGRGKAEATAEKQWASVSGMPDRSLDEIDKKLDAIEKFLKGFSDSPAAGGARTEQARLEAARREAAGAPEGDPFEEAREEADRHMKEFRFGEAEKVWEVFRVQYRLRGDEADREREAVRTRAQEKYDELVTEARRLKGEGKADEARRTLKKIADRFGTTHADLARDLLQGEFK